MFTCMSTIAGLGNQCPKDCTLPQPSCQVWCRSVCKRRKSFRTNNFTEFHSILHKKLISIPGMKRFCTVLFRAAVCDQMVHMTIFMQVLGHHLYSYTCYMVKNAMLSVQLFVCVSVLQQLNLHVFICNKVGRIKVSRCTDTTATLAHSELSNFRVDLQSKHAYTGMQHKVRSIFITAPVQCSSVQHSTFLYV